MWVDLGQSYRTKDFARVFSHYIAKGQRQELLEALSTCHWWMATKEMWKMNSCTPPRILWRKRLEHVLGFLSSQEPKKGRCWWNNWMSSWSVGYHWYPRQSKCSRRKADFKWRRNWWCFCQCFGTEWNDGKTAASMPLDVLGLVLWNLRPKMLSPANSSKTSSFSLLKVRGRSSKRWKLDS